MKTFTSCHSTAHQKCFPSPRRQTLPRCIDSLSKLIELDCLLRDQVISDAERPSERRYIKKEAERFERRGRNATRGLVDCFANFFARLRAV